MAISDIQNVTASHRKGLVKRMKDGQSADGDLGLLERRRDYSDLIGPRSLHAVNHFAENRTAMCKADFHGAPDWQRKRCKYVKTTTRDGLKQAMRSEPGAAGNINLNQ